MSQDEDSRDEDSRDENDNKEDDELLKFREMIPEDRTSPEEPPVEQGRTSFQDIVSPPQPVDQRDEKSHPENGLFGTEEEGGVSYADSRIIEPFHGTVEEIKHIHEEAGDLVNKLIHVSEGEVADIINQSRYQMERLIPLISKGESLNDKVKTDYLKEDFISNHSANVVLLSLEIAKGLGYDPKLLLELGVCTLFHDLGMAKISGDISGLSTKLSDREFGEVKKHPIYGGDFLRKVLGEESLLHIVALQEHEREDGSGYPYGLKSGEIHEYAKIIGLADVFEALCSHRKHRKGFTKFHAVQEILHWGKPQFNYKLLRAFLDQFTLFPINSYVRLNSNEVGKVVSVNKEYPTRPVVQILYDEKGMKLIAERIVELYKESFLYITEVLEEEKVLSGKLTRRL